MDSCYVQTPPLPLLRAAAEQGGAEGEGGEEEEAAAAAPPAGSATGSCSSGERCGMQQQRGQERWAPDAQHACGAGAAETQGAAAEESPGSGWIPVTPLGHE